MRAAVGEIKAEHQYMWCISRRALHHSTKVDDSSCGGGGGGMDGGDDATCVVDNLIRTTGLHQGSSFGRHRCATTDPTHRPTPHIVASLLYSACAIDIPRMFFSHVINTIVITWKTDRLWHNNGPLEYIQGDDITIRAARHERHEMYMATPASGTRGELNYKYIAIACIQYKHRDKYRYNKHRLHEEERQN